MTEVRDCYPAPAEVDGWCDGILADAEAGGLKARLLEDDPYAFRMGVRHTGGHYVEFIFGDAETFYGFWQPCPSGEGPVLFHVPGYGAEMSAHPELVSAGFNVLHINPLGYATPEGPDESKRPEGAWPVLPDTVRSLGEEGYVHWLTQAAAAVLWGLDRGGADERRFGFFGTSQGGGCSLLLASIFSDRGAKAVAADEPFLVNFPLVRQMEEWGAYAIALNTLEEMKQDHPENLPAAWHALGFADATCHAHRLTMPTLLTAGQKDPACPPPSVWSLFEMLPGTRSYTEMSGQAHAYTTPFLHLARAWFRLYV